MADAGAKTELEVQQPSTADGPSGTKSEHYWKIFWQLLSILICLMAVFSASLGIGYVQNVAHPTPNWSSLSLIQQVLLPLHTLDTTVTIEWWGVITSFAITLYIYWICFARGWIDQIPTPNKKASIYLLPVILTMTTGLMCMVTIGSMFVHLICLTLFFGVFVMWDITVWRVNKIDKSHDIAIEMERKAKHWLVRADLPIPMLLWGIYFVSGQKVDFVAGCIATVLFLQVWNWGNDCVEFGRRTTKPAGVSSPQQEL